MAGEDVAVPVAPDAEEIRQCFALTGLFMARHVFEPRGLSPDDSRRQFLSAVLRDLKLAS